MLTEAQLKKLRWQCSERSMRELDVLMGRFFEHDFPTLDDDLALAFAELAEKHDMEIWSMVIGQKPCENPIQAKLIDMLKQSKIAKA